jgi:16S rRNA (uracil1498-N3)-methyltransferase
MAERFYINCPLAPGPVVVEGSEAHHLATVCRVRPGDPVCLFNGDGSEYPARVIASDRRRVTVEVIGQATPVRELPAPLEVAAPLPRGDRAQLLLEKLTELGVTRFVPLQTKRSVVHPREAKRERLQRTVIEASKQCGRNVLLQIEPLATWDEFCRRGDLPGFRLLAHPGGDGATQRPQDTETRRCGEVCAVGPEGGFTDEEVGSARAAGWQVLDLGPRILRVETAAIVMAVQAAGLAAGDLGRSQR